MLQTNKGNAREFIYSNRVRNEMKMYETQRFQLRFEQTPFYKINVSVV